MVSRLRIGVCELVIELNAVGRVGLNGLLQAEYSRRQVRALLHLCERQIEFVLRRGRQCRRIVQNNFTSIVIAVDGGSLFEGRRQIARRPAALDEVVRHHHVDSIVSTAFRHVAIEAGRARSGERCTRHAARVRRVVAAAAHCNIVLHRTLAPRNVVRVVAGHTRHLTVLKAWRLPQPVRAAGDLELVAILTIAHRCRGVVEVDERIAERPPRVIRKRRVLVAANLKWEGTARRLEVALHAHFQLPFPIQGRRVDDGAASRVDISSAHRIDMPLSWAMTTLAIDPFRQVASESGSSPVVQELTARVAVMARHAPFVDDATKVEVRRPIVAGTHRPMTAAIRIPGHR